MCADVCATCTRVEFWLLHAKRPDPPPTLSTAQLAHATLGVAVRVALCVSRSVLMAAFITMRAQQRAAPHKPPHSKNRQKPLCAWLAVSSRWRAAHPFPRLCDEYVHRNAALVGQARATGGAAAHARARAALATDGRRRTNPLCGRQSSSQAASTCIACSRTKQLTHWGFGVRGGGGG